MEHCVKNVRIRSYSGPHFLAFRRNTQRYGVSLRIQSERRQMRTRTTPNTDTFHAVEVTKLDNQFLDFFYDESKFNDRECSRAVPSKFFFFLFGTIINSTKFDVPNFQTRLLYKVDK